MGVSHKTRVVIGTADCDALGHMNVARYFALCNQNGFAMQGAMGWVPGEVVDGQRLSFAVVHSESDFKSEVLEGEALVVETDISEISDRSATFRNCIWREDGTPVFESHWKSVLLDLDTRRAAQIPASFRETLARYMSP
ncbi:thioesterase family protein [Sedimentitalea todarodis]|uniref:Thioesterase family protein n=1 Tax=Sedimentitalea todarodis TaxID=1631240 RepID=A0ABU3VC10_9RHOB|nr:thioesterase family protein [Sedimentitalea todarodis]